MGLQSALSTALTGLNAAETTIDVVGNNVANSQTVGFKESNVSFATQFLQTLSIGAAPSDQSGGTNPRQLGLGVKVSEIAPDFTQGTIEISSNPLDVAIQGDGFLLVQGSQGELLYTRNGQLSTNQDNEVVTTQGQRVLGFNAVDGEIIEALQPITIPIGGSQVNRVTETATFSGNLSPQADPGVGGVITSEVFGDASFDEPDPNGNFTIANIQSTPSIDIGSLSASTGAGLVPPQGTYSYRITFVDSDGNETAGSSPVSFTTGSDGTIDLTGIPQADGTDYVARNIYRTTDGNSTYYLAGSIADATTTTFSDSLDDATLANPANELNTDELDSGAYSYYITFFDPTDQVETRPTAEIGTVAVSGANQRIRLDGIPQPTDSSFSRIRIYRNDGQGSHRLVEELNVSPTSDVYVDSVANADLGAEIDLDGPKLEANDPLRFLQIRDGSTYSRPFENVPGVIRFTGSKGVIDLATKEFTVTDTTTVQEYIDFLNQSLGIDRTVPNPPSSTIVNGQIVIGSNIGIENFATIDQNAFTFTPDSTGLTQSIVLDFAETTPAEGEGTSTDFVVYDSLGIPLSVRLTTVLESTDGNNTFYRWFATSPDNEVSASNVDTVVGSGVLTFDGQGDLVSTGGSTNVTVSRTLTASNSPLSFDLDFSSVSGLNITDNLGNSTSTMNFLAQDGFPPGVLTNFAITEGGEVRGVYSNGIEETLAQVRMARFTNNKGLQAVGNNLFAEGVNSGEPQFGNPGDSGIGSLTAGAVELSNTDIGQNLIELILASTQYRGGARVITAVQELLDELLALQR